MLGNETATWEIMKLEKSLTPYTKVEMCQKSKCNVRYYKILIGKQTKHSLITATSFWYTPRLKKNFKK